MERISGMVPDGHLAEGRVSEDEADLEAAVAGWTTEDHVRQIQVEEGLLNHIAGALRMALEWSPASHGVRRKLSTLQFIAEAFRRHLHRLASISEHDGYLAPVIEKRPTFSARVTALQDQRRRLLDEVDHVLADLDPQAADDPDAVALRLSCAKLANLMDTYERYREQETELIQDAFLREVGGES